TPRTRVHTPKPGHTGDDATNTAPGNATTSDDSRITACGCSTSSTSLSRVNLLMLQAVRAVDHVVKLDQVDRLRDELESFAEEMFVSLPRKDQRRRGACYLRGLMVDGKRKSIQPMAARLPDGNEQALQQFVSSSPWDP